MTERKTKKRTTMPKMRDHWQAMRDAGFDVRLVQGADEDGTWRVRGFGADVRVAGDTALEVDALMKLAANPPSEEDRP